MITRRFSILHALLLTALVAAVLGYTSGLIRHRNALRNATDRVTESGGEVDWIENAGFWEETQKTPYFFEPIELRERSVLLRGRTELFVSFSRRRIGRDQAQALGDTSVAGVTFYECEFSPGDLFLSQGVKYCLIEDYEDADGVDIEIALAALGETEIEYLDVFTNQITEEQVYLLSRLKSLRILQFVTDSEKTIELNRPFEDKWTDWFPHLDKAHISVAILNQLREFAEFEKNKRVRTQ